MKTDPFIVTFLLLFWSLWYTLWPHFLVTLCQRCRKKWTSMSIFSGSLSMHRDSMQTSPSYRQNVPLVVHHTSKVTPKAPIFCKKIIFLLKNHFFSKWNNSLHEFFKIPLKTNTFLTFLLSILYTKVASKAPILYKKIIFLLKIGKFLSRIFKNLIFFWIFSLFDPTWPAHMRPGTPGCIHTL